MTQSNTTASRSQAPGPIQTTRTSRQVTRAARRRKTPQATQCAQVIASCTQPVSDEARAFYRSTVDEGVASRSGARHSAKSVVDEWLGVTATLQTAVIAGLVAGYGAIRMRYAAEIAQELATPSAQTPAPAVTPDASAPVTPTDAAPTDVAALKRAVAQALRNLGYAVNAGVSAKAGANEVSHTLEQLAEAVQRAQAEVPAEVMTDAGLTPKVIEALSTTAQDAMSAYTSTRTARAIARTAAERENVLVGRLAHETRLLVASARTSRKSDRHVPKVSLQRLARSSKKTATKTPAAPVGTVVATPAPVAETVPVAAQTTPR